MSSVSRQLAIQNRILASLPHAEFSRVQRHLETVSLEKGEIVYLPGDDITYVLFLNSGLLSLVSTTEAGSTIVVASVGYEGLIGLPLILRKRKLPYEVTVQFAAKAFKISAHAFQEEFNKGERFHEAVLGYVNVLLTESSQAAICSRFHSLEEMLSRFLLIVQERVSFDSLNLTHENISDALGVPRNSVSVAAGALQREGLIRYSRGKITILDRDQLKAKSCECYRIIHDELKHFLND